MKKKSILLLLVALTLSLVFGLVGCTTVSEGEGVKLSNETTFSLIKDKNDAEFLLDKMSNYHVVYDFAEGDMEGFHADYFYSVTDGDLSADYSLMDADGKVLAATNIRSDFSYTLNADGSCVLGIYVEALTKKQLLELGAISFDDQNLSSGINFNGTELAFSTTNAVEGEIATSYDWVVDYETLLIKNLERTVTDVDGNVVQKATISFGYGVEDFVPNLTAYETITDPNAEQVSLTVLFNPDGQNYEFEKTYTVAIGTNVVFNSTESGESYLFYENAACTRDIENVGEYLEYYKDLMVFAAKGRPQFSFEFTLCDEDVEEMQAYIDLFLQMIEEEYPIDNIEGVRASIEDKMVYFVHMYYMGQIQYYNDITREKGQEALNYAMTTYYDMYDAYIEAYKVVYEKGKGHYYYEHLFFGWTDEDFAIFEQDNDAISALEEANSLLEQEYDALDTTNVSSWALEVEEIYAQFVANNQELAKLNGYDNAYDYLAETSYNRYYSVEERAAYHEYFKNYIIDMQKKSDVAFDTLGYTQKDITDYYNEMESNVKKLSNKYIGGYINTFDNSLQQKMKNMYEKEAARFAMSNNSAATAFANYSSYYGEAFTFFGSAYQDIMTIIHEMGHYISFDSYSLGNMGYDLAETHSQGNEWLMLYYLKDKMPREMIYNMAFYLRLANGFGSIVRATLVDEFEYRVYTAETPIQAGEFKKVMQDTMQYFGMMVGNISDYYESYALRVVIGQPAYYLNYATSEIASMGFYAIANLQGYEVAQEVYRALQEDCDISKPYGQILKDIGLSSPFEEQTYKDLKASFFPED